MAKTTSQLGSIYLLHQEQVWLSFPSVDGWMDGCDQSMSFFTPCNQPPSSPSLPPPYSQPSTARVLKCAHHLTTEGPSTLTTLWTQPLTSRRGERREGKGVGRKGKGTRERKGATFPQMAHSISRFISHFSRADIKPRMYKHS